jgi:CheY-like chemotaxis protein
MKKILIIEDNQSIRSIMKMALEESGYEVLVSGNGYDALELLLEIKKLPSLIILDLMMPVMNGFEFRKTQLQDSRLANIPVILLTANNAFQEQKEKLQAHEFLNKPVDIKDLLYIIENFFFINERATSSL